MVDPVARSEGHRLLTCAPGSLAAVAAATGFSKQVVGAWRQGKKAPGPEARAKLKVALGIPIEAWGQRPAGGRASSAPPARPPAKASAGDQVEEQPTTMEGVEALLRVIRAARAPKPDGKGELLASEQVKLADAETRLLALRHRLEKEAELLEDRIVKQHPMWARMKVALGDTLVRWPEAARAVMAVLREFDA